MRSINRVAIALCVLLAIQPAGSELVAKAESEPPNPKAAIVAAQIPTQTPETPHNGPEAASTPQPVVSTPTPTKAPLRVVQRTQKAPSLPSSHEDLLREAGIAQSDWQYVDYIINHEGSWEPCKVNGGAVNCSFYYQDSAGTWHATGGHNKSYGICQALPGYKMASAGSDWQTNPLTQLKWCNSYGIGRYHSWKAAYLFWIANRWW